MESETRRDHTSPLWWVNATGAFRVSYKPSGFPSASRVTIVPGESPDKLFGLVRGYVENERQRLIDYRENENEWPPRSDARPRLPLLFRASLPTVLGGWSHFVRPRLPHQAVGTWLDERCNLPD